MLARPARCASGVRPRIPRVLIVDDQPGLAAALRALLSDEFDVQCTPRSLEAFVWLSGGEWYDVILCDVMMPAMTGVELRERVHALHPDVAARIVFMTGGVSGAHIRTALDAVPNLVLEKPVELEPLRELIRRRARVAPPPVSWQAAPGRSTVRRAP
ncbi:MAG TPA: response regulator [Polyangiaceae bacterium]|jgi:CheY-like chemotaxis protein